MGTNDEIARRKKLSFAQAEGLAALPQQLARTEVSDELRAVVWGYVHGQIQRSIRTDLGPYLGQPWAEILRQVHVYHDHKPADEFSNNPRNAVRTVKAVLMNGSYEKFYGWLEFVMKIFDDTAFSQQIDVILTYCRAPYRVVDGYVIFPIASEQEAQTVIATFADLQRSGLEGGRQHLTSAATHLTQGKFADSVRESIHAVESVARALEPSAELSKALAKLEKSAQIHSALKKGFLAIYGYSSDEKGIRHPLIDDANAKVDEADALFMIGACAAFVSYLINKARSAGILGTDGGNK